MQLKILIRCSVVRDLVHWGCLPEVIAGIEFKDGTKQTEAAA